MASFLRWLALAAGLVLATIGIGILLLIWEAVRSFGGPAVILAMARANPGRFAALAAMEIVGLAMVVRSILSLRRAANNRRREAAEGHSKAFD